MRQHEAHVHGEARGNLSVDARTVRLNLELPAYNLIGFEHAPTDAEQQSLLDRAVRDLESSAWLTLDPAAQCGPARVAVDTPGLAIPAESDPHDHDHSHDDHAHDHHAHGDSHDEHDHHSHEDHDHPHDDHAHHDHDHAHGHGSFQVTVELDCDKAEALRWMEIDLFSDYENNRLLRMDVLTETRVLQVDLGPDQVRIDLSP
jgi:hypothetical protein